MTRQVFISHASEDAGLAREVCEGLEGAGISCWIAPRDIPSGHRWAHGIVDGIETSSLVVVVFTRNAQEARGVRKEVLLADEGEKHIFTFRLEDLEPERDLKYHLLELQWVDGFEPPRAERLTELAERIRDALGPDATNGAGRLAAPTGVGVLKLPARNLNFVGRESLLADVEAALADSPARVAISGGPGFGKSQLAHEYAHRHLGRYELALSVPAEGRDAAMSSFAALADELGLPPQETQDKAVAAVRSRLADSKSWLLIFDNAERPSHIRDLLPDGNGHVLITSLERSGWKGIGAHEVRIGPLSAEEGTRLLLKRTGRDDEAGAASVAAELDGNPLLLEHAAAYIDDTDMPFAEYVELLREDFDATLAEGMPDNYPRTAVPTWNLVLAKVVESSPEAGDLFSLSGFLAPDDIPISDLGLDPRSVSVLVRYSLVQRTGDDGFSLHRTVQRMAFARLTNDERRKWAETAVKLCLRAFPDDPSDVLERPRCARLLPHATAALAQAENLDADPVPCARLLDRVGVFHRSRARYADGRAALEGALELLAAHGHEADALAGTVRSHLGGVLGDLGEFDEALACHEAALLIHETVHEGEHSDIGDDRAELGSMFLARDAHGDLAGAREQLELALAIHASTRGDEHRSVAVDHMLLASVFTRSGKLPPASEHYQKAIAVYEALGKGEHPEARIARFVVDYLAAAASGSELGSMGEWLGEQISIYEQAYGDDHPEVAELRQTLADHQFKVLNLEAAAANYAHAFEIDSTVYGARHWKVGRDLMRLFVVLAAQGETEAARERLQSSLAVFDAIVDAVDRGVPLKLVWFDDALASLGALPAATYELERVVAICREVTGHSSMLVAAALEHLGAELHEAGDHDRALHELTRAGDLFERYLGPQHVRLARCLSRLAAVHVARDELVAAEKHYERACAIHELAESRNDLELLNDLLGLLPVRLELDRRQAESDPSADSRAPEVLERIREVAGRAMGIEPLRRLADGLLEAGELDEALTMYEDVLEKLEATYGQSHPEVAEGLNRLALAHARQGNMDTARSCFERALGIHGAQFGADHVEVAIDLVYYLTPFFIRVGQPEIALRHHERGIAIFDRLSGADDPDWLARRADAWLKLGDLAVDERRHDDARFLYEASLDRARDLAEEAVFHGRLGALAAARDDSSTAFDHLTKSAALFAASGRRVPFSAVVRASAPPFRDSNDRHVLDDVLRQLRKELIVDLPSAMFRPRIAAVLPRDWVAKESMTFLAPDGQANVIASSEQLDDGIDSRQYADVQGELLRSEFPGYEERGYEQIELFGGGRRGYLRHFEWTPPDGVPVTQLQVYYAESGRGYTATATTPSSNFPNVEAELRGILAGLSI